MAKEGKNQPLKTEYRAIDARFHRELAISQARPKLETAFFVIWAVLDLALVIAFGLVVVTFMVNGAFIDARLVSSLLVNSESTHNSAVRSTPVALEIGAIQTASISVGEYDIFVEVTNTNSAWYVTFDYVFAYSGGVTAAVAGFVNPGETHTLAAINLDIPSRPTSLEIAFQNLTWHRLNSRDIPDVETYLEERQNITLESATYAADITVGSDNLARSSLTFMNRTAYSYWEPEFLIKLLRGKSVVSITTVTIPEFKAGETRQVEVRWFGNLPATATVAVESVIPYLDQTIYMKPSGE